MTDADELAALRLLDQPAASWNLLDVSPRVAERARGAFSREPVRTLDAIHLATVSVFAEAVGQLRVLSQNDRVPLNASAVAGSRLTSLGFHMCSASTSALITGTTR